MKQILGGILFIFLQRLRSREDIVLCETDDIASVKFFSFMMKTSEAANLLYRKDIFLLTLDVVSTLTYTTLLWL